ncbi:MULTISPECIES: hypothetical protein [environmental samples]|uniref:hypothetical protein n=1 Tax=environmental samples TaxID=876090 RepID=UPI00033F3D22|nr:MULTISPECIES: hypothetical protein [environmental samples]CDC71166.1 putative uncharacterized protein [Oscillibacter sp. CAG:155]
MKRRKLSRAAVGFAGLIALVVVLMLANSLRPSPRIELPSQEEEGVQSEESSSGDGLTVVEIRPDTVQAAVATLERPETYQRELVVQQFWDNGSGTMENTVTVSGGWTRVDQTLARDRVRHSVTDGRMTYIWYNSQRTVYAAQAGEISADMEQAIPTYEDVLDLPVEEISAANYQTLSNMNCIYVETAADAYGYVLKYWVSVDSGLLVAAEKLLDGETVYRMWETSADLDPTIESEFTLPDGTDLLAN